jgi:hypothetical protein
MAKILICLNSEQVVANVIALEHVRPDRLVVISTPQMTEQLESLRACAVQMGIPQPVEIILVPPWDFTGIEDGLSQHPTAAAPGDEIILNATGGTKPMALTALHHFQSHPHFSAIYLDSRNGVFHRFAPPPATQCAVAQYPDIPLYLRAYGFQAESFQPRPELELLSLFVERELKEIEGLLVKFKESLRDGMRAHLILNGVHTLEEAGKWRQFLLQLTEGGIISSWDWGPASRTLTVKTIHPAVTYRYFGQCGWLEHLVYTVVKRFADETLLNVKAIRSSSDQQSPMAEYDVVARFGATLVFFECKGGNEVRDSGQLGDTIQAIHSKAKLAGGVFAKPILVLAGRFHRPTPFQRERARVSGVEIIIPDEVTGFLDKRVEELCRPFCGVA